MKTILRAFVLRLLKLMAKRRMKKFKGKVVAVTGSCGKTSTKDAIFAVLNTKYSVKRTNKSMNSEFGLPLTILDIDSGFSSAVKWSWLLTKAFFHSFFTDHSDILLLEFGVDKPKDMNYLLSVVKPDVSVITNIFPVHLDDGQFATLEDIYEEKKKIAISEKVILNVDNEYLASLCKDLKRSTCISFGKDDRANYKFSRVKTTLDGVSFDLHHKDDKFAVTSSVLGNFNAYVLTPAVICGELFNIEKDSILAALSSFTLPPGRMNAINGIKESVILDSSYNSSPEALLKSFKMLKDLDVSRRRVAVVGNMNELGEGSVALHEAVGDSISDCVDILITVGSDAKRLGEKAKENGVKEVHSFSHTSEAIEFFRENLKDRDLILVKGSQNRVRLERFVKEFMLEPERAKELLVRQDSVWKSVM